MLPTITEESDDKLDDVVLVVPNDEINGNRNNVSFFSKICPILCSHSPAFCKLIKRTKRNRQYHSNEIFLKHMTLTSFTFIKNTYSGLDPILTYHDIADVLYSAIKYKFKAVVKQCYAFLMNITNVTDYFIAMQSFSAYPKALFEPFFINFGEKSQFLHHHTQSIVSHPKMNNLSLFQMELFCEFVLSQNLISHKKCYQIITNWCRYQFSEKFECLLLIKGTAENDREQVEYIHSRAKRTLISMCFCNVYQVHYDENEHLITKWQHLFENFALLLDFTQMDVEYLLTVVRCDHIMHEKDLLAVLAQKYENDQAKMKRSVSSPLKENRSITLQRNVCKLNDRSLSESNISSSKHESDETFKSNEIMLNRNELTSIRVGYQMDIRDGFGKYLKAEVIEVQRDRIKISFIGWNSMWDKWLDIGQEHMLMAPLGAITDRQINKMQLRDLGIGEKVIIKLPTYHKHAHFGWINAEIINMDKGQLNVQYHLKEERDLDGNDIHEYWVHADNIDECR